jgi:hypothetical protein
LSGFSRGFRRQTVSKTCHRVSAASPNAVIHSRTSPTTVAAISSRAAYGVSAPRFPVTAMRTAIAATSR